MVTDTSVVHRVGARAETPHRCGVSTRLHHGASGSVKERAKPHGGEEVDASRRMLH